MLGHPYPEQMLEGMSAETYRRWLSFDQAEPFGPKRDDLRMAIQTIYTLRALGVKRHLQPEDLMPQFKVARQQSITEMERVLQQWASAVNRNFDERHQHSVRLPGRQDQ